MQPDELNRRYKDQLARWIKASNRQKQELATLTRFFDFDEGGKTIDRWTFSRLIQGSRPVKQSRKLNLCRLLAVLYMLGIIAEKEQMREFWDRYDIGKLPNAMEWDEVFQIVEEGCQRGQGQVPVVASTTGEGRVSGAVLAGLGAMATLAIIVLIVFLRPGDEPKASVCTDPVEKSASPLIRDQGFSLYLPNTDLPESSVLNTTVRSIAINNRGLWVGYFSDVAGVSRYDKVTRQWQHCLELLPSARQSVNDFAVYDETVFVATDGRGIALLHEDRWTIHDIDRGLQSNAVYDLYVDDDGGLWAATYEGVAKLVGERWEVIYQGNPDALVSSHVIAFLEGPDSNLWFALGDRGIGRLTPEGQWLSYYADVAGFRNARAIVVDDEGGVWFATDGGGVLRFFNEEWAEFTVASGALPSNGAQDVERDRYGRIWVATDKGVVYSADFGGSWLVHSTANTWDIAFGCSGCAFDEDDMWLVVRGQGIGHCDLPPPTPVVGLERVPEPVQLTPGEEYVFQVEAKVLTESLELSDGLFSAEPEGTDLYGAYHRIPVIEAVQQGGSYLFTNINDPIVAPTTPGHYQLTWRVWQSNRYVTDSIVVEFEVVDE